jgi:hypothetical protein
MERSSQRNGEVAGRMELRNGQIPVIVRSLVRTAEFDTAYRGEYLRSARELLNDSLPRNEYIRLKQSHERLDDVMRKAHRATDLGDWEQVETLARQAEDLREMLARHEDLLGVGDSVYGAPPVHISHLAAALNGLTTHPVSGLDGLRSDVVRELRRLEEIDENKAPFYAQRRRHFEHLRIAPHLNAGPEAPADQNGARDALRAAIQGHDWRRAERLAHALARQANQGRVTLSCIDPVQLRELAEPYPPDAVEGAISLGLRLVQLPDTGALRAFLSRVLSTGRASTSREPAVARPETAVPIPSVTRVEGRLAENLELLAERAFVNSAGLRYLPVFAAETMLVEPFAEDDPSETSPVLDLLRLAARRGRTRAEIENALFAHGHEVLGALGLDPMRFSIVCIPFDAYLRLAPVLGWGLAPFWTHFDGYQLTPSEHLRALVGGDARYGGAADLCSVGIDYSDAHMTARFAVVRRMRLLAATTSPAGG